MAESKDPVEAQIKDVYQIQGQKSTTTAADQTINQGFEGHVKNTDDETLDLNQVSGREGRHSSKVNPGSHGTLLQTIEPIEAKQIEFAGDSPQKDNTKSTSKIEEKSNEGDDDPGLKIQSTSLKKIKDGAENEEDGAKKLDKSHGTQQSDERLNGSQELLINQKGEEEPQDKSLKARAKRLFEWGKANPLKVIIIVLCIIIFSLLVCIPIKDWQIRTYPEKIERQQAILEGLRLRTADMERWVVQNKSRYERMEKNAEYMMKELLNQTYGPEGIEKKFTIMPDISRYHNKDENISIVPTLPTLLDKKTKTGGPLNPQLQYKYDGATVDLKVPDLLSKMGSDRDNILGVYNFRNVQMSPGSYHLFDMYVMLVDKKGLDKAARLERVSAWRKNEMKDTTVCCMNGGEMDLNSYMSGFGLIIRHYKGPYTEDSGLRRMRSYCDWIYEGEFNGGFDGHTGFGRLGINSQPKGQMAVGYWSGFQKLNGKAVVHISNDDGEFVYAGKWNPGKAFNKKPDEEFKVIDLSTK